MSTAAFSCNCGNIKGEVAHIPAKGNHLLCYCESCRAGANYCGAGQDAGTPVDLYLTQPEHVTISDGLDRLAPFNFSPKGVIRWKAACCGVQMFSSQANPKIAFMSITTKLFETPDIVGPVMTKAFVPKSDGKTGHEGKGALAMLVLRSLIARVTGRWRQSPLHNIESEGPIAPVTLVSREEKTALLAAKV